MLQCFNRYFISLFRRVIKAGLIPAAPSSTVPEGMAEWPQPRDVPCTYCKPALLLAERDVCKLGKMRCTFETHSFAASIQKNCGFHHSELKKKESIRRCTILRVSRLKHRCYSNRKRAKVQSLSSKTLNKGCYIASFALSLHNYQK